MNKKLVLFALSIFLSISYLLNIDILLKRYLLKLSNNIQETYINIFISIENSVDKYLNQINHIEKLEKANKTLKHYKILYEIEKNKYDELNKISKIVKPIKNFKLRKVEVLSYVKMRDFSKVILDVNDIDTQKIYALLTLDGFSAGIVLSSKDITIAYLNQHKKCNYTVFIGKNNIPGITSGMINDKILIKFIPIWKHIKVGDEVITSSMDSIFPYGIKVGKVTKVIKGDNTQEVLVQPYANVLGNRFFYMYEI